MFCHVIKSNIPLLFKDKGDFNMLLNTEEDNKDKKDVGMEEESNSTSKKFQEATGEYEILTGELKLNCLYGITKLSSKPNISLRELFQGVANLIPPAWQFPQKTNIKIIFNNKLYFSNPYKETDYKLTYKTNVNKKLLNFEVSYSEDLPFLKEEEALIIEIGTRLKSIIEQMEAEKELLRLNRLKSDIIRRTSHELKTPLISIKGFSDLLLTVHREKLDEDLIPLIEEIKDGSLRLEKLIANILNASDLDSNTIKFKKKKEDLGFLIRFCVNEMNGLINLRNQSIIIDIQGMISTEIEKERIYEVLGNLLSNAIKYTPPNGIIRIGAEESDGFVVVSIKDNGIGFTEEEKLTIFKQFGKIERFGQGLEVKSGGTGLGLYISKKIVELHGGKIWVKSSGRNKGSTFYFSLPISNNRLLNTPYC